MTLRRPARRDNSPDGCRAPLPDAERRTAPTTRLRTEMPRREAYTTPSSSAESVHTSPPPTKPARGPNASASAPIVGAPAGVPPMKQSR